MEYGGGWTACMWGTIPRGGAKPGPTGGLIEGGSRTTGFPPSPGITPTRETTEPAGELMTSVPLPNDDLRLMATLGVYMLPP